MAIKVTLFIVFILAIFVFAGLAAWRWWRVADDDAPKWTAILFTVLAPVFIFLTIFVPGNIHQVNSGEVAVVRKMGTITGTREAGVYWDFYMTHDYVIYDKKVQEISIETQTYSKDNQIIGVQADLQYQINSSVVDKLATEYGSIDKLESKVKSIALDNIKSVFAQNTATDVINNRASISSKISETVENSMKQKVSIKHYNINGEYIEYNGELITIRNVDPSDTELLAYIANNADKRFDIVTFIDIRTIVLTNIDFTDDFEAAVAAKVAEEQKKQQALIEQERQLKEDENNHKIAVENAEAEAEAAQTRANAEAEVARIKAQADQDVAKIEADTALYAGQKNAAIAIQKLAGINGWSVITITEDPNNTPDKSLDDIITYKLVKYVDNNYVAVTEAELAKGVEKLMEVYKYEAWDGKLPTYQMGENGFIAVTTQSTSNND